MPVNALSTTTLGAALNSRDKDVVVASSASISQGNLLVCRAEAMRVLEVVSSTQIVVARGVSGTEARAHASGQRFFIGTPDDFQNIKNSATSLFGDSGTYPDFMLPGQRATDGAGREYVLLAPTLTMYKGSTALISRDGLYTATLAYTGRQGSVAVTLEQATSTQYVWGQIYGRNDFCQDAGATSDVTSAYIPIAQTSVSSPAVGMAAVPTSALDGEYAIYGMFIAGAGSSGTTSAASATGVSVPVWLNYPYIRSWNTGVFTTGA